MPDGQPLNITRSALGKLHDVHTDSVNFLCSPKFFLMFLNCGDRIVLQCGILFVLIKISSEQILKTKNLVDTAILHLHSSCRSPPFCISFSTVSVILL